MNDEIFQGAPPIEMQLTKQLQLKEQLIRPGFQKTVGDTIDIEKDIEKYYKKSWRDTPNLLDH